MQVYHRKEKTYYEDVQYGGGFLKRLYGTKFGRLIMPVVLSRPVSKVGRIYTDTFLSKRAIPSFINKNHIDMKEYEDRKYKNLNDFFTRRVKEGCRPIDDSKTSLVSPADSKLSVYPIEENEKILVKANEYTVRSLVGEKVDLKDYCGGLCLVFRLSVDDYHRYCFPVSGQINKKYEIKGRLHTVCDISEKYKVYQENSRKITVMSSAQKDEMVMIEVGALMVGRIVNHEVGDFTKGQEKGYFCLGGSTIILLIPKDLLTLDEDIVSHAIQHIEVKLRYGERIGDIRIPE